MDNCFANLHIKNHKVDEGVETEAMQGTTQEINMTEGSQAYICRRFIHINNWLEGMEGELQFKEIGSYWVYRG